MIRKQKSKKQFFFILTFLLFSTTYLSSKTFKNLYVDDIKIYGTNLFSKKDIVKNSSLNLPTRLIFIKTKFIEKELKQNLSLENVSISRQILPFGLKVLVKPRTPAAYAEKIMKGKKIFGFVDDKGFFIYKNHSEVDSLEVSDLKVFGWHENHRKILSKILTSQKNYKFELIKISFSQNGFLTLEEKDLKTILIGFNQNLISSLFQIISNIKEQLNANNFSEKIDNIDLTDPKYPKIKVFKP